MDFRISDVWRHKEFHDVTMKILRIRDGWVAFKILTESDEHRWTNLICHHTPEKIHKHWEWESSGGPTNRCIKCGVKHEYAERTLNFECCGCSRGH